MLLNNDRIHTIHQYIISILIPVYSGRGSVRLGCRDTTRHTGDRGQEVEL
jgi:hypothetical protein